MYKYLQKGQQKTMGAPSRRREEPLIRSWEQRRLIREGFTERAIPEMSLEE